MGRSHISCFFSIPPAVPAKADVAGLVRVWLLYLSGCIYGYGPERSQTPTARRALVLFWRWFEEWKWNRAHNAFHASLLMLTNGFHCAFFWEYLDGICFHDGVFIWHASQHFCSFTIQDLLFFSMVWGKIILKLNIPSPTLCPSKIIFSLDSTWFIFFLVLDYTSCQSELDFCPTTPL